VGISTGTLNRLLKPNILLEITLSNGQKRMLDMDLKQFHNLRFGVATMLKEMTEIENDATLQRDVKIIPGLTAMY
jgi:hypothetical protein